eukprot:359336-Amphidinium_carterae.1
MHRGGVVHAVRDAGANFTTDREIVLAAVEKCWLALEYAEGECKSDREIVFAALSQNWEALQFVSEDCSDSVANSSYNC